MKNLNTYKFAAKVNMPTKAYPEMDRTKTFIGEQQRFHNSLAFLRLIVGSQPSFSQFVQ